jgi:hypothetical protein
LNDAAGDPVLWREHVGRDDHKIDGTLTSSNGRTWLCQVTRVERGTLAARGRFRHATSRHDNGALADNVMVAIKKKMPKADTDVVLVLDANDAPAYTDDDEVRELVGAEAHRLGYLVAWRMVWLVGPTVGRTHPVQPPSEGT